MVYIIIISRTHPIQVKVSAERDVSINNWNEIRSNNNAAGENERKFIIDLQLKL